MRISALGSITAAGMVLAAWACGESAPSGPPVTITDTIRVVVHDTVIVTLHDTVRITVHDTITVNVLDTLLLDTLPAPTIMMQNYRVGQRLIMSVDFFDSGPSIVDTLAGPSYQNPNPNPPAFPYVFSAKCVPIPAGRVPSNFFLYSPDDPSYPNGYDMFVNTGHWQDGWVVQSIVTPQSYYLYAFPTQTPCKA